MSYPVMGEPPVLDGVVQPRLTSLLPVTANTVETPGTVAGVADASLDTGDCPAEFSASTS